MNPYEGRTNRYPAVDERRCGADSDERYAPAGCLLVEGHAGPHGLAPVGLIHLRLVNFDGQCGVRNVETTNNYDAVTCQRCIAATR